MKNEYRESVIIKNYFSFLNKGQFEKDRHPLRDFVPGEFNFKGISILIITAA